MVKRKNPQFTQILTLGVIITGMVASLFLVKQNQDLQTHAQVLPTPTPASTNGLTITSPNGGEVWRRGNTYQITWTQSIKSPSQTAIGIYTRKAGVDTYVGAIAYNVSNQIGPNSYSWTIPLTGGPQSTPPDGSNIILSIVQYNSSNQRMLEDKSDNPFALVSPSATLISPNGGEVWQRGNTYNVTWNQTNPAGSVSLHIYTRGATDTYVGAIAYYVSNLSGLNTYSWTVPLASGAASTPPDGNNIIVEVDVRDLAGNVVSTDKSNAPFTITSAQPMVLINGNFESGSLSPWTTAGGAILSTTYPHSGSYNSLITGTGNYLSQNITSKLQPNVSYTFSGWIYITSPGNSWGQPTLRLSRYQDLGTSDYGQMVAAGTPNTWQLLKFTHTFTSTELSHAVYFGLKNFGFTGSVSFDDATVSLP